MKWVKELERSLDVGTTKAVPFHSIKLYHEVTVSYVSGLFYYSIKQLIPFNSTSNFSASLALDYYHIIYPNLEDDEKKHKIIGLQFFILLI